MPRVKAVGQYLRTTRQERGEDLYDVADFLRIRPSYLFALEEGDLDAMPGRPYAFGFLRSYADHLGFDGNAVVAEVKAMLDGVPVAPRRKVRRAAPASSGRPALSVGAMALVLIVAGLGGWRMMQSDASPLMQRLADLPGDVGAFLSDFAGDDRSPVTAEAPAASKPAARAVATIGKSTSPVTASKPVETATREARDGTPETDAPQPQIAAVEDGAVSVTASPVPASPATETPATETSAPDERLPERLVASEPETTPLLDLATAALAHRDEADGADAASARASEITDQLAAQLAANGAEALLTDLQGADDGRVFGDMEAARVVLVAKEPSWIQIKSSGRDYIRSRTLEAGDRFALPDRSDLALWTGNAGGLEVVVDGRNLGSLGGRGAVMRDVALAPQALNEMRR